MRRAEGIEPLNLLVANDALTPATAQFALSTLSRRFQAQTLSQGARSDSIMVGTSGSCALRIALVTASGLSLPSRISGRMVAGVPK